MAGGQTFGDGINQILGGRERQDVQVESVDSQRSSELHPISRESVAGSAHPLHAHQCLGGVERDGAAQLSGDKSHLTHRFSRMSTYIF